MLFVLPSFSHTPDISYILTDNICGLTAGDLGACIVGHHDQSVGQEAWWRWLFTLRLGPSDSTQVHSTVRNDNRHFGDSSLLGCDAASFGEWAPTFRRNVLPSFSRVTWMKMRHISQYRDPQLNRCEHFISFLPA